MKSSHYSLIVGVMGALLITACSDDKAGEPTYSRQLGEVCDEVDGCLSGLYCEDGICRKPCSSNNDCSKGYACQDNRCVISDVDTSCGNGQEDTGEQCDDGNNISGDGCSAKCNKEENWVCTGWPSQCQCAAGLQDSDHDGTCLPDCNDSCGQCYYWEDGTANCECPSGFQDSNSDGVCNPVCDCDSDGICSYDNNGLAFCTTCAFNVAVDGNSDFVDPVLSSPENPVTMEGALDYIEKQQAQGYTGICTIKMAAGIYQPTRIWKIKNTNLIGLGDSNTDTVISADTEATIDGLLTVTGDTSITNLTFENGHSGYMHDGMSILACSGGAIVTKNNENLTINNCLFKENSAGGSSTRGGCLGLGGAININSGKATITGSEFSGNRAAKGGALSITNSGTAVTINDSTFTSNFNVVVGDNSYGGAIFITQEGAATINNCTFSSNYQAGTDGYGAAIAMNTNSQVQITNSYFSSNQYKGQSSGSGGAIYSNDSTLTVDNSNFHGNGSDLTLNEAYAQPILKGGSIYADGTNGQLKLTNNRFFAMSFTTDWNVYQVPTQYPQEYGLAIYNGVDNAVMENNGFYGASVNVGWKKEDSVENRGSNILYGGVIYNSGKDVTLINSLFEGLLFVEYTLTGEEVKGAAIYNSGTMKASYITALNIRTINYDHYHISGPTPQSVISSRAFYSETEKGLTLYNSLIYADKADGTNVIYNRESFQAAYNNYELNTSTLASMGVTKENCVSEVSGNLHTITCQNVDFSGLTNNILYSNNLILASTTDSITFLNFSGFTSTDISSLAKINVFDIRDLKDKDSGTEEFIDMGRDNVGPQPTDNKDLFGNQRDEHPDLGAIEFVNG